MMSAIGQKKEEKEAEKISPDPNLADTTKEREASKADSILINIISDKFGGSSKDILEEEYVLPLFAILWEGCSGLDYLDQVLQPKIPFILGLY